ncbi:aconitase family protein [Defluviimonas sp. D31]|uniref:cis-3-hydroxy-L-proline dehydratase n=1 Tax=Defluviimonas sp. D31 TaxID=3083253 RepID=UPI00296EF660|nr:aconitase family protein [Defluviimonas sp. D31]MDW4549059.1 aconitase family protein [Defluviimonas sp. D31]
MATSIIAAEAEAPVVVLGEGLSFWGGVDPASGQVIDAHHPDCGAALAGRIVMMPTSRGSCSGSGVLLELALNGHAPAALIFREAEDILTLGALIADRLYDRPLSVLRLDADSYAALAAKPAARITGTHVEAEGLSLPLTPLSGDLALMPGDRAMLSGTEGEAARLAMEIIGTMAAAQGATALTDVTRAHIDGCIYASPANLTFARTMADMGARVRIPTTTNAISVDHANWRAQGVPPAFGDPAARLADAYVEMGAAPSFTCAPYLLDAAPATGEAIAWAESNAVLYANSVLGARTVKHPDFLDLCIALTGRAPLSGVYLEENRRAGRVIRVELPEAHDDALWPMLGYLAGKLAPDRIPLLTGLEGTHPSEDDLKALCAAFGTTSAAPMLHVAGITPEAGLAPAPGADEARITRADLARTWAQFNAGPPEVDLVAFGSPHFSAAECRKLADLVVGHHCHPGTAAIVTLGRDTLAATRADGTLARLEAAGIRIVPDLCWCSISEPVFPPAARTLMTNSGKYAHYAPALSGRAVRFGSLADCVAAALTGRAPDTPPDWLT